MLALWDKRMPIRTLPALAPALAPPVALRRLRSMVIPAPAREDARATRMPSAALRPSMTALPLPPVRKMPRAAMPAPAIHATRSAAPGGLSALASLRQPTSIDRIGSAMAPVRPALPRLEPALAARREPWEPVAVASTRNRPIAPEGVPWLREASSREAEASPTDAMDLTPLLAEALRQLGRE